MNKETLERLAGLYLLKKQVIETQQCLDSLMREFEKGQLEVVSDCPKDCLSLSYRLSGLIEPIGVIVNSFDVAKCPIEFFELNGNETLEEVAK